VLKTIVLLLITLSSNSWAWYYPEHAVIADEALKILPPQIKKILAREYKTFAEYNKRNRKNVFPTPPFRPWRQTTQMM
jgi:hypothetical protein